MPDLLLSWKIVEKAGQERKLFHGKSSGLATENSLRRTFIKILEECVGVLDVGKEGQSVLKFFPAVGS